ncbi:hypothetical protein ACTFIW_013103 [Dictyostelium discoideum]
MKNFKILKIILLLISCCTFFNIVNSITVGGLYSTPGKWKFITKFCFQDQGGHVIMKLFHSLSKDTKILLYSDKNPNYNELLDDIYGNKYSCEQKVSWNNYEFSPFVNNPNDLDWESRMQVKSVMQQRDRFWIVAIADCERGNRSTGGGTGSNVNKKYFAEYVFSLSNNGDHIDSVLSADQQSIPQSQMFYFLLYIIMFVITIVFIIILKKKQLESKVLQFFIIILGVQLISLVLFLANWSTIIKYDGPELKYANLFGNIFSILANSLFVLLILMVGQGWTTSLYYGSMIKRMVNLSVSGLLFVFGVIVYIFVCFKAPEFNNYIYFYDTYPGYALLAIYVFIIFFFTIGNTLSRRKQNDEMKKKFILIFTIIFTLWFIAQPMIVVCAHFTEPWVKFKVISILYQTINAIFYIVLLILFRPTKNNIVVKILESDDKFGLEIKDYPSSKENSFKNEKVKNKKFVAF